MTPMEPYSHIESQSFALNLGIDQLAYWQTKASRYEPSFPYSFWFSCLSKIISRAPRTTYLRKVPGRPTNAERRSREHLALEEVQVQMKAAGDADRNQQRDKTLILIMFRCGLRANMLGSTNRLVINVAVSPAARRIATS